MLRTSATGGLSATRSLSPDEVAAIRAAASGTGRISVKIGSGSTARCATFAKSLAVTPQIWFAPLDRWPWFPYVGSTDYAALFASGAPWPKAAGRAHVFKFYMVWLREASDARLRQVVAALKARDIAIAIEVPPLIAPLSCGQSVEGFGSGSSDILPLIRRIVAVGGTVRFLAMDEPFKGGSLYTGPRACRWSIAKVAGQVARFSREIRAIYPSIVVGDIEPWPSVSSANLERWQAAYEAASGSALPFLHLDVDMSASPPDWAVRVREIQRSVQAHGTRFGLIYNGGSLEASDADWLRHAREHFLDYELDGAGPPDDAILQSWTDRPDRLLPESNPATFTHLITDYTRTRTSLTIGQLASASVSQSTVEGRLETLGGVPLAGATVDLAATPRDGAYQVLEVRGRVPAGASEAVVGIRVNEPSTPPASADLELYEVGYAEGDSGPNLVPNARFDEGLTYWVPPEGTPGISLLPSDHGAGSMMRIVATPADSFGSNSGVFRVTPGAAFRVWVVARVPEASIGSTWLAAMFLGLDVPLDLVRLAPAPVSLRASTTDAIGAFSLPAGPLEAGRYRLRVSYDGDATYWPARAETEMLVP
jgi:hypothetical protein